MATHMALDTTITSTLFMDESHLPRTNGAQKKIQNHERDAKI